MSSTMTLESMIKKVKQASQVASTTVMGPEYAQELKNILQDDPAILAQLATAARATRTTRSSTGPIDASLDHHTSTW